MDLKLWQIIVLISLGILFIVYTKWLLFPNKYKLA